MKDYINTTIISLTVIIVSAILGVTFYNVNNRNHMASNIEAAISKGMDPMSVRCAYSDSHDIICVAYAAGTKR